MQSIRVSALQVDLLSGMLLVLPSFAWVDLLTASRFRPLHLHLGAEVPARVPIRPADWAGLAPLSPAAAGQGLGRLVPRWAWGRVQAEGSALAGLVPCWAGDQGCHRAGWWDLGSPWAWVQPACQWAADRDPDLGVSPAQAYP